jgi:putative hemolysin
VGEATADTIAIGPVVLPLTYFTVVVGELVPKSFALKNTMGFALRATPWLSLIDKIFGPIVTLFEWSTKQMLGLLSLIHLPSFGRGTTPQSSPEPPAGDAGEDSVMLEGLSSQHRQYVMNLVNLERKRMRDIFVPWKHVIHVEPALPAEQVEGIILASGHTRIPVCQGDDVAGILNTKEFMVLRGLAVRIGHHSSDLPSGFMLICLS